MVRRTGFGDRRREAYERLRLANLEQMGRSQAAAAVVQLTPKQLEGPGSAGRLSRLQRKFRALGAREPSRPRLALLLLLTFSATVAVGLLGPDLLARLVG